jgi:NADH-quinone oxidoreductase subunit L
MTRVFMMTFLGKKRWSDGAHPHESPFLMWAPMVLLAVGSVASGFLLYSGKRLEYWLKPVVDKHGHSHEEFLSHTTVTTLALSAVAIGVAFAIMKYRGDVPTTAPESVSPLTKAARRDLLQDDFNEAVLMRPGQALTKVLVATDEKVIDGAVRVVAGAAIGSARGLRTIQSGYVRNYALLILLGVAVLIAAVWVITA